MKQMNRIAALFTGALVVLTLAGCAGNMQKAEAPAAAAPAHAATASEYYIVVNDAGRYYVFGDAKNYFDFISHGEVALTRTRIGAGPGGNTVVFGITKPDVKNNMPSLAEQIFDGKLQAGSDFHGEVVKNGRYYVFGDLKDMVDFAQFGEVPYSYTDIGAGPKGETLVWVMNKASYKKGRPVATIAKFESLRTSKQ